ncbi:MAG TPA: DUF2207 domain-containing protein, partial [Crocinitomicaceae bacterium]|nr:DUF2207 domain-containing protein [Crocinitomicaceae bacterium]
MKNTLLIVSLFLFIFSGFASNAYTEEKILHYHSDIEILPSRKVRVTETIKVYVGGRIFKHGIFRELPLSYEYKGGNVHVGFELVSVKKNGTIEEYHIKKMDNGVAIYIGKKEVFLNNDFYTYEIVYVVDEVLLFNEKFDEIYWNVNGNGWGVRMDSLSATVYPPKGAKIKQFNGYTGAFGATDKEFSIKESGNSITYMFNGTVDYYENMTVAVGWEKGFVTYPTFWDKLWLWIKTYILYVIGGGGLLANAL